MDRFHTRPKVLPTVFRLFIGLVGVCGLIFLFVVVKALIVDPSTLLLVMTSAYSTVTVLFLGFGLFSIKTFQLGDNELIECFLWGLHKRRSQLREIAAFKSHKASNKLGTFEELILNKRNGDTVFIQEFDQRRFKELKSRLSQQLTEDNTIKPNYWNGFYKTLALLLLTWYGIMIVVTVVSG
jgi:hypothetical protein